MFAKIQGWLIAIGGVLAALFGMFLYGTSQGKRRAKEAQISRSVKVSQASRKIERDVKQKNSQAVDSDLDRWYRD